MPVGSCTVFLFARKLACKTDRRQMQKDPPGSQPGGSLLAVQCLESDAQTGGFAIMMLGLFLAPQALGQACQLQMYGT